MSIHSYLLSGSNFKKAQQLTLDARQEKGEKAEQLFHQALTRFAAVSESYSQYADALYYWGFALFHQAQTKSPNEKIKIFEAAISKFSSCQSISPNHLGAAVDGGVALLGLAKSKKVNLEDELYLKAKDSFELAETIQSGSASYNLACMYAIQNKGDACLKALNNAREYGLVPSEENIINDDDLQNIKNLPWFAEYIKSLTIVEEEIQEVDIDESLENKDS